MSQCTERLGSRCVLDANHDGYHREAGGVHWSTEKALDPRDATIASLHAELTSLRDLAQTAAADAIAGLANERAAREAAEKRCAELEALIQSVEFAGQDDLGEAYCLVCKDLTHWPPVHADGCALAKALLKAAPR